MWALRVSEVSSMGILIKSFFIVVIYTFISIAQQNDNNTIAVENALAKLKQKVLLSDEQTADVKSIIMNNLKEMQNSSTRTSALNDSKEKVERLLDDRQKSKYAIIKDDWWNNLIKSIEE